MKTKPHIKPEHVFRALSDETRLRILNLLRTGELCVCDLVSVLDVPQPTASRHLAYLRKVGLVSVRKEGTWCYYSPAMLEDDLGRHVWDCVAACASGTRFASDLRAIRNVKADCCN